VPIIDDAELVGPSIVLPHITRCDLKDLPYCTTPQRNELEKINALTRPISTVRNSMSRSEPRRMKHKSGNRWRCGAVKLHACAFCSSQHLIFRYVPHSNTLPHTTYTRRCVAAFHYRTVDRSCHPIDQKKKNRSLQNNPVPELERDLFRLFGLPLVGMWNIYGLCSHCSKFASVALFCGSRQNAKAIHTRLARTQRNHLHKTKISTDFFSALRVPICFSSCFSA
jgi:hypothetical protein